MTKNTLFRNKFDNQQCVMCVRFVSGLICVKYMPCVADAGERCVQMLFFVFVSVVYAMT